MRAASALLAVFLAACIRNPKDLPGPQEGGFVEGVVVEQNLGTGDLGGVAGALITELGTNARITADADGRFMLQRLPIGKNLYIDVRRPPQPGVLAKAVRRLPPFKILVDGQIVDLDEIRLGENGALEGRVLLEQEGAAPVAAAGTAVVVASTAFKGLTSEDGTFLIPSVPQGTFEIVAFRPGYRPTYATGVSVSPSVTVRVRDLVMSPGDPPIVPVTGEATLFDAADGGHAGTDVHFVNELDPSSTIVATTDADGRYQLDVPAGVYRVRFTHDGYGSAELEGVAALEEGVIGLLRVTLLDGATRPPPGDDRDGDGCPDAIDRFPEDAFGCFDNDEDGIPDEIDTDDDNDDLTDFEELSSGFDGFITNPLLEDTDGDEHRDDSDTCPTVPNADQDPSACLGNQTGLPPRILSIAPATGRVGTPVTITGRNFIPRSPTSVQFGVGAIAVASSSSVSTERVVVRVPRDAATGPLTVISGGRTVTSSASFEVIPPPRVLRAVPSSARASGTFAVVGFDLLEGDVFIGGVAANERDCTQDEMGLALPGQQVVCAQVPAGATTGRLEVRTDLGGPSFEVVTFVVLSGPIIYEVRPSPAARDIPITIIGDGFDTTDTGGVVMVELEGAGPVTPTRVRNHSIEVTVPATAVTGLVRVHHPAGTAVSSRELIIDDGSPVIYDVDHTLVEAGDTLVLLGAHLGGASAVEFSGGATGTNVLSTEAQISVTVPSGVDPGPITITVAAGQAESRPIAVLERGPVIIDDNLVNGIGLSADGGSLYALSFTTPPELIIVDTDSMAQTRLPIGGATAVPNLFAVTPDGSRGLLIYNQRIHVINLPSGTLAGTCPRGILSFGGSDAFPPRIDDRGRYAFTRKPLDAASGEEGFMRIDLSDGSCEFFVTGMNINAFGVQGLLFEPLSGELLVSHTTLGHWYADVETGIPTTPIPGMPAFQHAQLFRGFGGPNRIYAVGGIGFGLLAVDLFSGRLPEIIHTGGGIGSQTRNGRWLFVGPPANATTPGYFVDLLEERVARDSVMMVKGDLSAADLSRFFIDVDTTANDQIQVFGIQD